METVAPHNLGVRDRVRVASHNFVLEVEPTAGGVASETLECAVCTHHVELPHVILFSLHGDHGWYVEERILNRMNTVETVAALCVSRSRGSAPSP